MQNIEQFVKEVGLQEIKPLQTCEFYFLTFPKKRCGVSVIRFAVIRQIVVHVDTRFYQDTDEMHSECGRICRVALGAYKRGTTVLVGLFTIAYLCRMRVHVCLINATQFE